MNECATKLTDTFPKTNRKVKKKKNFIYKISIKALRKEIFSVFGP